jgi:hypothetical protein
MTDDDFDALLAPRRDDGPDVRAAILKSTSAVVRRRGRWRSAGRGAGLLTVMLTIFCAGRWSTPLPAPSPAPAVIVAPVAPTSVSDSPPPAPTPIEVTPERLEVQAELATDPAEVAALYRRAGDAFLASRADVKQAVRCYRLHLAALPPDDRAVAATDSWLLSTMKN